MFNPGQSFFISHINNNDSKISSTSPFSEDAVRAGGILSGLADGLESSSIPGAEAIASILSGLGGGLADPSAIRNGHVDINSLVQRIEKRQSHPAHAPPTTADMERASSILSGLASGLKGSSIPGGESVSSILQGLGGGLDQGAKVTTAKRQSHPEHPPATAADMQRASSILNGLGNGMKSTFPGSKSVSSILTGLSGGLQEGAKNAPANNAAAAPKAPTKRQTSAVPPSGSPEAAKSAGQILGGLAKGIDGSKIPANTGVAGILESVAGGLNAAGSLPASPVVPVPA